MKQQRLDFTPEQIDELIDRLNNKCLREEDYPLLADLIKMIVWLNLSLKEKQLSIRRLRSIFGIKTESAKKLLAFAQGNNPSTEQNSSEEENSELAEASSTESKNAGLVESTQNKAAAENQTSKDKPGAHGHRPSSDYLQAKTIEIAHQALKKGCLCPECLKGKLYPLKPGTVLRIIGQPWLQVEIYRPERLRCNLCGKIFTAILPQEIATGSRADSSAKTIVSLLKYRAGVPFYRQEQMQEILESPISASEIWEMTEAVANALQPVYAEVCRTASEADVLHNDDTSAQILSIDKERQEKKGTEGEEDRTGTFTTAILAKIEKSGITIGLFFTGRKHAGENLNDLLHQRQNPTPPIQQCDALSRNIPEDHDTQLSNCNAHARRKFYELVEMWPKIVTKIIGWYACVFANDKSAPEDPEERLKWHQQKSTEPMEEMKKYCNGLIERKEVEPNSGLGKAINYLNKHWDALTLFLRIPGAPLHNNENEQLIKRSVLNRKNAYFFRNETGAKIADILMSMMETCSLNKVNPYKYLMAIQKYQKDVIKNPELWVPWKYEARLKILEPH